MKPLGSGHFKEKVCKVSGLEAPVGHQVRGVPPLTEHMQSGGPAVPVHASGRGTGEGRHPRRGRQGGLGAASAAWAQHQGEAGAQDGGGVDSGQSRATPRAGACRFWGRCWEVRAELCSPRSPRRGRAGRVAGAAILHAPRPGVLGRSAAAGEVEGHADAHQLPSRFHLD